MKVLVIPDVHLKPWMFERASGIMKTTDEIDMVVCLGDIPDDWNQQNNIKLYEDTFDSAIEFAIEFPETLWCYGNHEISYKYNFTESGYSYAAEMVVRKKLHQLEECVKDKIQYVHKIDNVLFSHAGVSRRFAECVAETEAHYRDIEFVVTKLNSSTTRNSIWVNDSPIWFRPQLQTQMKTFYPKKLFQVVGHTPMKEPIKDRGILSCDTFSTYPDGSLYGDNVFVIIDTENWNVIQTF